MKSIVLSPAPVESVNGRQRRSCRISRLDAEHEVDTHVLWFEVEADLALPADDDCDSYVLAMVMDAMLEGRRMVVHGSVSLSLLSNLTEYQWAWHKWLPEKYTVIDIQPDQVRADIPAVLGAISAFSGGADATFSAWRHAKKQFGFRSQHINLSCMVQGFDIPLTDNEVFERALARSKLTLDDLAIPLRAIRTNYRDIARTHWEHAFSCALVATLQNFKMLAGTIIVGSSEPYESLVIPWGSNPITDHLLGSSEFVVIHDGASHSRTEKIASISAWPVGVRNLRVCWQGDLKDRNCGVCEKCMRTKLNFLASGHPVPDCFDNRDDFSALSRIRLNNSAVRAEWQQILDYAKQHGTSGPWGEVRRVVRRLPYGKIFVQKAKPKLNKLLPRGSRRRQVVSSWLRAFDLN